MGGAGRQGGRERVCGVDLGWVEGAVVLWVVLLESGAGFG